MPFALIGLLGLLIGVVQASASDAPNVLVILSDDQGWGDVEYNCDNSTGYCANTPNLHELATEPGSAYFHRFYAAGALPTQFPRGLLHPALDLPPGMLVLSYLPWPPPPPFLVPPMLAS